MFFSNRGKSKLSSAVNFVVTAGKTGLMEAILPDLAKADKHGVCWPIKLALRPTALMTTVLRKIYFRSNYLIQLSKTYLLMLGFLNNTARNFPA